MFELFFEMLFELHVVTRMNKVPFMQRKETLCGFRTRKHGGKETLWRPLVSQASFQVLTNTVASTTGSTCTLIIRAWLRCPIDLSVTDTFNALVQSHMSFHVLVAPGNFFGLVPFSPGGTVLSVSSKTTE